ncbi:hypothetical protein ACFLZ9_00385 [Patescibacteria group bacterium]
MKHEQKKDGLRAVLNKLHIKLLAEIYMATNEEFQERTLGQIDGENQQEIEDKYKLLKIRLAFFCQESIIEEISKVFTETEIQEIQDLISLPKVDKLLIIIQDFFLHLTIKPGLINSFKLLAVMLNINVESSLAEIIDDLKEVGIYTDQKFNEEEERELNKSLYHIVNNRTAMKLYNAFRGIRKNLDVVFSKYIDPETIKYIFADKTMYH